jgi:hypothetical protein
MYIYLGGISKSPDSSGGCDVHCTVHLAVVQAFHFPDGPENMAHLFLEDLRSQIL